MSPVAHKTRNLLAVFSLRGGRLRKRGRGVVSYAPSLMVAASAAVLGSLFALSAPSFARPLDRLKIAAVDDVVAGDEGWIIAIDDVAADAGGWITAVDDAAAVGRGGIAAYAAEAGSGFAAFGDVAIEAGGGIAAFGKVEEEIATLAIGHEGEISADDSAAITTTIITRQKQRCGAYIVYFRYLCAPADHIITVTPSETAIVPNIGVTTLTTDFGTFAISTDTDKDGDVTTTVVRAVDGEWHDSLIVNGSRFFRGLSRINGAGTADGEDIDTLSHITIIGTGTADGEDVGATTSIATSGNVVGGVSGVYGHRSENGHIDVVNNADVNDVRYGIQFTREGKGELDILNSGKITGAEYGIHARHIGDKGDLRIRTENRESGLGNEIVSSHEGIFAQHDGEGDIMVYVESGGKVVSEEYSGVFVEHNGEGRIDVLIQGETRGGQAGVSVVQNRRQGGFVDIWVGPEAEVHGDLVGIQIDTNETGGWFKIDVAGKVSSAENGNAVVIGNGGSSNYLTLRPGFSLDGAAVSNGERRLQGTLQLSGQSFSGPVVRGVLDLSTQEFRGFRTFKNFGHWEVTGEASEDEAFQQASSWGNLRFSDVDFRMQHRHYPGFEEFERFSFIGTLEIVGSNRLRGGLQLGGKIVFEPDSSLTISENYASGSYRESQGVVFNADLAKQSMGKLIIEGDAYEQRGRVSMHVSEGAAAVLVETAALVEVRGYAQSNGFEGEETIGAFDYVLDYESVGRVLPVPSYDLDRYLDDLRDDVDDHYSDLEDDVRDRHRVLINGLSSDYHEAVRNKSLNREELEGMRQTIREARKAQREALDEVQKAYAEASSNIPSGRSDFSGFHTWRFRRDGLAASTAPLSLIVAAVSDSISAEIDKGDNTEGGTWAKQQNSFVSLESGAITGSRSRMEDNRVHFGLDVPAASFMGGDMIVGASMWQGSSISDVSSPVGNGGIDVESHAAALTASWQSPDGFYVDGQTRYARFLSDISAEGLSLVQDNEGTGVSASVETGYRFAAPLGGMDFHLSPQMELVWSRVDFEDFTGPHNELVSLEDGDLVRGRLGLSWDSEWRAVGGSGHVYGGVNLRGALDGRTSVNVSGFSLVSEQRGLSVDGRLGVSYEWDEGYAFHGEAVALRREGVGEVRANLGVRIDF